MIHKTLFVSNVGYQDAQNQAMQAGYTPTGQGQNRQGQFVVFAQREVTQEEQQRSVADDVWGKIW